MDPGGNGYSFSGNYSTKGCYAYKDGKHANMAFYGVGGTEEETKNETLELSRYRPMGHDCNTKGNSIYIHNSKVSTQHICFILTTIQNCLGIYSLIIGDLKYGIGDGKLRSDVQVIGSCTGTQSSIYECGGEDKYVKWSVDLGNEDFMIKSRFKVEKVAGTALAFVLWSGKEQFRIGLDGEGNTLFYEGGSWGKSATFVGKTNLKSDTFQNIVIRRTGNALKIVFDGKEWDTLPIHASVDAVGWRPRRNTIGIKTLDIILPTGDKNRL